MCGLCVWSVPVISMAILQVLKLIYSSLCVAFTDFPQSLVFVSSLPDILLMDLVHRCLLVCISCGFQVMFECLKKKYLYKKQNQYIPSWSVSQYNHPFVKQCQKVKLIIRCSTMIHQTPSLNLTSAHTLHYNLRLLRLHFYACIHKCTPLIDHTMNLP